MLIKYHNFRPSENNALQSLKKKSTRHARAKKLTFAGLECIQDGGQYGDLGLRSSSSRGEKRRRDSLNDLLNAAEKLPAASANIPETV